MSTVFNADLDIFSNKSSNYSNFSDINPRNVKSFVKKLPKLPGRVENRLVVDCDTLPTNDSLAMIIPGWEGIPTNIMMNFFLSLLIVIGFIIIRWRVYKAERGSSNGIKSEQKTDWLHFIYGDKTSKENILFTTRETNREHPNAYLPLILHDYVQRIKGRDAEDFEDNVQLYRRIAVDSTTNTNTNTSDNTSASASNPNPVESSVPTKQQTNKTSKELSADLIGIDPGSSLITDFPSIRTHSSTLDKDANEELQIKRLKSVLWNEDIGSETEFSASGSVSATKALESKETLFGVILKNLSIKDEDIRKTRGCDALQYLLFQRYIIYFLVCVTLLCLTVILPTNLKGDRLHNKDNSQYRRTTILNIKKDSNLIWIHTLTTLAVFAMGIFLMHSFRSIVNKKATDVDKHILMIENIPKSKRDEKSLKIFFKNTFPKSNVKRITFVYDINKMLKLSLSLLTAIAAKRYCIEYMKKYGQRCEVRPYSLGNFWGIGGCCHWFPKVDGLSYYHNQKTDLEKQIDEEVTIVAQHPQRIAFVVFDNPVMAKEIYQYFQQMHCHCYQVSKFHKSVFGRQSDPFDSWKWRVSFAPFPDDIKWSDIGIAKGKSFTLDVTMNLLILIVFLFLSTPQSVLSYIRDYMPVLNHKNSDYNTDPITTIFWAYFPTITLLSMTAILPMTIQTLTTLIPHRTISDYNFAIMLKSYLFLLVMVVVLPSLRLFT